jgi:hypothetical protein
VPTGVGVGVSVDVSACSSCLVARRVVVRLGPPSPSYGKACEWYSGFAGWQAPRSCVELSPPNLFIVCSKGHSSLGDGRVPVLRTYREGIDVPSCLGSVLLS